MITDVSQAWVIRKDWSGDTSAWVVFFTKEFGLIRCYYKGGRLPKKQALLQPFIPLWLSLDVRRDAYFVRLLEMVDNSPVLIGQTLFAGLYINELVYYALAQNDPHPTLHVDYSNVLQSLNNTKDRKTIEKSLRRFERGILFACGSHMSLTHEADSSRPIVENNVYQFIPGLGFNRSTEGISGRHLLAFARDELDDEAVLKEAKYIMRRAIGHALEGREIKSRALYNS